VVTVGFHVGVNVGCVVCCGGSVATVGVPVGCGGGVANVGVHVGWDVCCGSGASVATAVG